MKPSEDAKHRQEHEANCRRINAWADQNDIKCTCGARGYGDTANHSSVCPVFKKYYENWKPTWSEAMDDPKPGHEKWRHPHTPDEGLEYRKRNLDFNTGEPTAPGSEDPNDISAEAGVPFFEKYPGAKEALDARVPKIRRVMAQYDQTSGMTEMFAAMRDVAKQFNIPMDRAHVVRDYLISVLNGTPVFPGAGAKFKVKDARRKRRNESAERIVDALLEGSDYA